MLNNENYGYLVHPLSQFMDDNLKPLTSAYLKVFYAGTSSSAYTYSDWEGTLNTSNIMLSMNGSANVIAEKNKAYKVMLCDALHPPSNPIWVKDNLYVISSEIEVISSTRIINVTKLATEGATSWTPIIAINEYTTLGNISSAMTSLVVSMDTLPDNDYYYEYKFKFTTPETLGITTFSVLDPSGSPVVWLGSAPSLTAGKTYEASVVGNLAVIGASVNRPSVHVWDGSRDYSFFSTGASTWYIDTPEKWAALCMISLSMGAADGSGLSNAKGTMVSKNIEVTEDLYFNDNYIENFSWETTYQNDSEKDILNNFAYVLRADGQRVALYLEAYCNSFNGNFHKIVGMYASSYTKYHPGIITDPQNNIRNISFEYCTLKNGMTRVGGKSEYFPSIIYDNSNDATYKNIRAYHCKTLGVGIAPGRGFLIGSVGWYPPTSAIMQNLSVQSCQAMLYYSDSYYYNFNLHAFIHNDSANKNYKFIHTFENENLVPS